MVELTSSDWQIPDPDAALIARAQVGDDEALAKLLHGHERGLRAFVRRASPAHLRAVYDPEDVVQDVMYEAVRRLGQFQPRDPGSFRKWVRRIAANRVRGLVRLQGRLKRGGTRRRVGEAGSEGDDGPLLGLLEELAVYERTPSRSAAAHELIAALQAAIASLPDMAQRVVRMRWIDHEPVKVVAAAVGRSEAAVQMLCLRSLRILRKKMGRLSIYM